MSKTGLGSRGVGCAHICIDECAGIMAVAGDATTATTTAAVVIDSLVVTAVTGHLTPTDSLGNGLPNDRSIDRSTEIIVTKQAV